MDLIILTLVRWVLFVALSHFALEWHPQWPVYFHPWWWGETIVILANLVVHGPTLWELWTQDWRNDQAARRLGYGCRFNCDRSHCQNYIGWQEVRETLTFLLKLLAFLSVTTLGLFVLFWRVGLIDWLRQQPSYLAFAYVAVGGFIVFFILNWLVSLYGFVEGQFWRFYWWRKTFLLYQPR